MNKEKLQRLEKLVAKAQKAYYFGNPIMSDAKYDRLYDLLKKYAPESSVVKNVGSKVPSNTPLAKVQHRIAMGSQNKINTHQDFEDWVKKVGATKDSFIVQEKIDGLSVELIYTYGQLRQAVTRGDGQVGEDITHNVRLMRNVKSSLSTFSGSLRGEIFLKKQKFAKYFSNKEYANPRNAAAGIARRKKPQGAEHLHVYYFDVTTDETSFTKEIEKVKYIKTILDLTVANFCLGDTAFVKQAYDMYVHKHRAALSYDIDGLVIKLNDLAKQQELGEINGRPKGQVAWKFEAETAETTLLGIRWDMGLTGRLTPVAMFTPVSIGGTTVQFASLHTWNNILKLDIMLKDTILVAKRGDIIPYVECRVKKSNSRICFAQPTVCSVCKARLTFSGEFLICPDATCPAKALGDLRKWIKTLELDFLGEAFVEKFFEAYNVAGIWQLYTLTKEEIEDLPGFAKISAEKAYDQIWSKTKIPLVTFLAGLNIPNISTQTFQLLINAGYDTIEKIQKITVENMLSIIGFGTITAQQVVDGLKAKEKTIRKLLKYIKVKEKVIGKLTGKSFCFTGEIAVRRPLAQKLVAENGGLVKSSVVRGLTYLVQADPKSKTTKTQKANEYNVKIISGEEFLRMVNFNMQLLQQHTIKS